MELLSVSASTITHLLKTVGGGSMTRGLVVVGGIGAATGVAATKGWQSIMKRLSKQKN